MTALLGFLYEHIHSALSDRLHPCCLLQEEGSPEPELEEEDSFEDTSLW